MHKSYGLTKNPDQEGATDFHLEEFKYLGYTIFENVLSPAEVEQLKAEVQRVYAVQEKEFGKENLKKINEEYVARALLCYSDAYINLARNSQMMDYVKKILGNYFILHLQNGIINMPNQEHHQASWHRDFPYQNWVSSEPIGCNLLYCLDDFSEETGATKLVPHSHKIAGVPSFEYMEKHGIQLNAKSGSAVLFNSMMLHKAGYNHSKDRVRIGINNLYAKAIVRPQINFSATLKGKYSDDAFLRMLLGYDVHDAGVMDWRNSRLNKK